MKPYFPQIKQSHTVILINSSKIGTNRKVSIRLDTFLTKKHTDNHTYEFSVVRTTEFKEISTKDTIDNIAKLYSTFLQDVHNAQNNIIINPEYKDSFDMPMFRRID